MDEEQRNIATLTFWSVYCLDRRWSFGTGMPFALQDSDIDPNLPKPVSDDMSDRIDQAKRLSRARGHST
jgi:hypothetical protein